jgi:hypothetical protein
VPACSPATWTTSPDTPADGSNALGRPLRRRRVRLNHTGRHRVLRGTSAPRHPARTPGAFTIRREHTRAATSHASTRRFTIPREHTRAATSHASTRRFTIPREHTRAATSHASTPEPPHPTPAHRRTTTRASTPDTPASRTPHDRIPHPVHPHPAPAHPTPPHPARFPTAPARSPTASHPAHRRRRAPITSASRDSGLRHHARAAGNRDHNRSSRAPAVLMIKPSTNLSPPVSADRIGMTTRRRPVRVQAHVDLGT